MAPAAAVVIRCLRNATSCNLHHAASLGEGKLRAPEAASLARVQHALIQRRPLHPAGVGQHWFISTAATISSSSSRKRGDAGTVAYRRWIRSVMIRRLQQHVPMCRSCNSTVWSCDDIQYSSSIINCMLINVKCESLLWFLERYDTK